VTALHSYPTPPETPLTAATWSVPTAGHGSSAWPLPTARRQDLLSSVLDGVADPSRVRRMPGDVLIGLPLSLVGLLLGRVERFRSSADVN
jgi:hypothetical protein